MNDASEPVVEGQPVRTLRRPGLVAFLLTVLGVALHGPSIGLGFFADDMMHQVVLREGGVGTMQPPLGLYDFGTLSDYAGLETPGVFPWWTDPDWKIRFFRPLSSASLTLDYALWGQDPLGYHVTSLALFGLACWLVWTTLTGLGVAPGAALLTLAWFALARATVLPVGWIANRNEVLALIGVLAALSAITRHDRWGRAPATLATLAACACACGAKESGIVAPLAGIAWLALATHGSRDASLVRWARVTIALLGLVAGGHVAALVGLGYGERSAFYVTPWSEPAVALGRFALLATAGWSAVLGLLPLEALSIEPRLTLPLGAGFASALVLIGRRVAPVIRGRPGIRFAVIWWLMALAPQAGAPASDRLLFPALVPTGLLLATFVWEVLAGRAAGRGRRILAWSFVSAGAFSALTTVPMQLGMNSLARDVLTTVPATEVGSPELGRREVFVLQVTDPMTALSFATTWVFTTDDQDLRFWLAQGGRRGLRLVRTGERTVEVESLNGPFGTQPFEIVYRTTTATPEVGRTWRTAAFEVTALEVAGGGVQRARFTFDLPLDDPRHRWVTWNGTTYGHVPVPEVGATLELPTFDPPNAFSP